MHKKIKVAVLANLKKNAPHWEGMPDDQWDDLDLEEDRQCARSRNPIGRLRSDVF